MNPYSSNSDEDEPSCVVIDNGSDQIKAGLNRRLGLNNYGPIHEFPSVLCHAPRDPESSSMDTLVGNEAMSKEDILALELRNPIVRGIVVDRVDDPSYYNTDGEWPWEDMEKIWRHTFNELQVEPEETGHSVLLTEPSTNPKNHREKMTQIMFETFNVPALYLANTAVLSLYATTQFTGLAIELGYGVSQIVPVYQGYALKHAIETLDVSGSDLTDHLMHLLRKRYKAECRDWLTSEARTNRSSQKETARAIKEGLAFIARDYDDELAHPSSDLEEKYELPDGKTITIGAERFGCVEPLFRPSLIDTESTSSDRPGIDQLAFRSIMHCDVDIRRDLYGHVVLCGGTTLLPDLNVRLTKELAARAPRGVKVTVVAPRYRKHSAFIGGCVLSSFKSYFEDICISKEEYDETGPAIIHRKCF